LKNAVSEIPFTGGGTFTGEALIKALMDFKESSSWGNMNVARVIILLTDGRSSNSQSLPMISKEIHSHDIITFAVGVGESVNEDELKVVSVF